MPVFLTGLSRAQTFSTGSALRSSPTVTSRLVPSTWRMCEMRIFSWAWKLRTMRQLGPTMRTWPSALPRKRLSEPEQTLEIS